MDWLDILSCIGFFVLGAFTGIGLYITIGLTGNIVGVIVGYYWRKSQEPAWDMHNMKRFDKEDKEC